MPKTTQNRQKAMSLIEVIISIAIGAFVLSAAASFVVSITEIWSKRDARYAFYEHADGVAEFLNASFSAAQAIELETSDNDSNNQATNATDKSSSSPRILWATPIDGKASDDPLLYIELKKETPLLTSSDGLPPIEKSLYLYHDEEGLSLLHSSLIQEELESENDLHRTLVSPYVKQIEYINWDAELEQWEIQEEPIPSPDDNDILLVPNFLRIQFEYEDIKLQRMISLPEQSINLVLY
jgi:prepilin-type N-terminal cleavage/methylation domain-containing protein